MNICKANIIRELWLFTAIFMAIFLLEQTVFAEEIKKTPALLTLPLELQHNNKDNQTPSVGRVKTKINTAVKQRNNKLQVKPILTVPFYDNNLISLSSKNKQLKKITYWEHKKPSKKPKILAKNTKSHFSNVAKLSAPNFRFTSKFSDKLAIKNVHKPSKKPVFSRKNNTAKEDIIEVKQAPLSEVQSEQLPVPDLPPAISELEKNNEKILAKSLIFTGDTSEITDEMKTTLNKVKADLELNPTARLQLVAFASGKDGNPSSARRISLARALAVREYLKNAGIRVTRMDVRALGEQTDKQPTDRVDFIFIK